MNGKKIARPKIDHSGKRFGRFVAISPIRSPVGGFVWLCRCDCGNERVVRYGDLKNGRSSSCGCRQREVATKTGRANVTHGQRYTRAYTIWAGMLDRCGNPENRAYGRYGGRGIAVCQRWRESFSAFLSDMGRPPKGLTLDRINNDGNYDPTNCRWATWKQQQRNKRSNTYLTAHGSTRILIEWSEDSGLAVSTICARLKRGWTTEDAVTKPAMGGCHA